MGGEGAGALTGWRPSGRQMRPADRHGRRGSAGCGKTGAQVGAQCMRASGSRRRASVQAARRATTVAVVAAERHCGRKSHPGCTADRLLQDRGSGASQSAACERKRLSCVGPRPLCREAAAFLRARRPCWRAGGAGHPRLRHAGRVGNDCRCVKGDVGQPLGPGACLTESLPSRGGCRGARAAQCWKALLLVPVDALNTRGPSAIVLLRHHWRAPLPVLAPLLDGECSIPIGRGAHPFPIGAQRNGRVYCLQAALVLFSRPLRPAASLQAWADEISHQERQAPRAACLICCNAQPFPPAWSMRWLSDCCLAQQPISHWNLQPHGYLGCDSSKPRKSNCERQAGQALPFPRSHFHPPSRRRKAGQTHRCGCRPGWHPERPLLTAPA